LDIRTREEIVQEKEEAKKAKAELMLDGVGGKVLDTLMEAGFDTLDKIKGATLQQLTQVRGIGAKKAEKILKSAQEKGN
jgi:excinuclease UvrABC nuclease subunit